jgi:hypothetical protein
MMTSPLSAAFAAGGGLESGCQAEYGIDALVRRRTAILFVMCVSEKPVSCGKLIGAWIGTTAGEKLPD